MSGGLETLPSRPFSGNSAALNSYCIPSVSPRPSRIVTNPPLRASPFVRSHREKEQQPLRRVSPKTAARMYSPVRTHARSRESPTPRRGKHVDAKGRYETTPRTPTEARPPASASVTTGCHSHGAPLLHGPLDASTSKMAEKTRLSSATQSLPRSRR